MPKQPETPVDNAHSDAAAESLANEVPAEHDRQAASDDDSFSEPSRSREYGGRNGLDPVRYGDWEKSGRCIDF